MCVCVVTCDYVHCRSLCTHGATLPDVAICTHEDEEVGTSSITYVLKIVPVRISQ